MKRPIPASRKVLTYIGIGANMGHAVNQVMTVFGLLNDLADTRLVERSSLFRTTPIDAAGDDYINAVACLETGLLPEPLLQALLSIEQQHGRQRPYHHSPRTMDLDILLYGQQQLRTPSLTVPHPRLTQRAFALIPLLQIAPMITIPGMGPAHTFVQDVAGQGILRVLENDAGNQAPDLGHNF